VAEAPTVIVAVVVLLSSAALKACDAEAVGFSGQVAEDH
jgi:hypothetical protein